MAATEERKIEQLNVEEAIGWMKSNFTGVDKDAIETRMEKYHVNGADLLAMGKDKLERLVGELNVFKVDTFFNTIHAAAAGRPDDDGGSGENRRFPADSTFELDGKQYSCSLLGDDPTTWKEQLMSLATGEPKSLLFVHYGSERNTDSLKWTWIKEVALTGLLIGQKIEFRSLPFVISSRDGKNHDSWRDGAQNDRLLAAAFRTADQAQPLLVDLDRIKQDVPILEILAKAGIEYIGHPTYLTEQVVRCCVNNEGNATNLWRDVCKQTDSLTKKARSCQLTPNPDQEMETLNPINMRDKEQVAKQRLEDYQTRGRFMANFCLDDSTDDETHCPTTGEVTAHLPNDLNSKQDLTFFREVRGSVCSILGVEIKDITAKGYAATDFQRNRYTTEMAAEYGRAFGLTIHIYGSLYYQLSYCSDELNFRVYVSPPTPIVSSNTLTDIGDLVFSILRSSNTQCGIFEPPEGYKFLPRMLGSGGECFVFAAVKEDSEEKEDMYAIKFWKTKKGYNRLKASYKTLAEIGVTYDSMVSHGVDVPRMPLIDEMQCGVFEMHSKVEGTSAQDWQVLAGKLSVTFHQNDFLYCDISPNNILWSRRLRILILTDVGSMVNLRKPKGTTLFTTGAVFPRKYWKKKGKQLDIGLDQIMLMRSMQLLRLKRRRKDKERFVAPSRLDNPLDIAGFIQTVSVCYDAVTQMCAMERVDASKSDLFSTAKQYSGEGDLPLVSNVPSVSDASEANVPFVLQLGDVSSLRSIEEGHDEEMLGVEEISSRMEVDSDSDLEILNPGSALVPRRKRRRSFADPQPKKQKLNNGDALLVPRRKRRR